MKKVFLAFTVIGLVTLTSCKTEDKKVEDATENAVEETTEAAETATETMENTGAAVADIPQFSNADVQKFAEEYAAYYKEVQAAATSGDQAKIQALQTKAVEWAQKAQQYTQKMTAEDAQKWAEWSMKIAQAAQGQ